MILYHWEFLKEWSWYWRMNLAAFLFSLFIALVGLGLMIHSVIELTSNKPVENADTINQLYGKAVFGFIFTSVGFTALIIGPFYFWLGVSALSILTVLFKIFIKATR